MELWHGSEGVVEHPSLDKCRQFNDYGRGFYCTPHEQMAMEWACRTESDGVANRYELDMDGLTVLDLESGEFSILNWLAILADNREFNVSTPLAREGLRFLLDNCLIDIAPYDIIRGYRADDSYFDFAASFLNNGISVQQLAKAMRLGKLGEQIVIKSKYAFSLLHYEGFSIAEKEKYYVLRKARNDEADQLYLNMLEDETDGLYMLDIMRGGIRNDDPRIPRNLSE